MPSECGSRSWPRLKMAIFTPIPMADVEHGDGRSKLQGGSRRPPRRVDEIR